LTLDTTINDDVRWTTVCAYPRLEPERGVAALVDGEQVAVFRTHDGQLFAIGQRDPIAGAYVMARGIVGSRGEAPTVASPLHKQVYDLRTGHCLDLPGVVLPTWPVRRHDDIVEVLLDPARRPGPPARERAP
jgi:nitrite reductase (NADH) small subunit